MTDVHGRIGALSPQQRARLEERLAELSAAEGPSHPGRIPRREHSGPAPLATAQHREWVIERTRAANNITGAFRVEGELDPAALSRVLTEIVTRHEVLRSTVKLQPDQIPAQVVHPVTDVPVPVVDLSSLTPQRQHEEVARRSRADLWRRFDPDDPLRLRVTLLRLAEQTHIALFCSDHAAADAWSMAIILREIAAGYGRHDQQGPTRPPPQIQYADFAVWQQEQYTEQRIAAEVRHWTDTLSGLQGLSLPADRPLPARPTFAGDVVTSELPVELSAAVTEFSARENVSLVMIVLAACSVVARRMREQHDLVIGTFVSGRTRTETEQLVGCFSNPVPLRMSLGDDQTLLDVVRQARDVVATALNHQDVPFDRLVTALGLGREASQTSLSGLWINVVSVPDMTFDAPGLRLTPEPMNLGQVSVDLTVTVAPRGDTLGIDWHYMTDVFDADTVQLIATHFQTVVTRLVTNPDTNVVDLRFTGELHPVSDPGPDPERGVVAAFRDRVTATPDAPAVIGDDRTLSFAELDAAAGRLAKRLRAHGVGSGVSVGILVDRSPRFAVAVVAVLMAGGAFVPIDPSYPPDRVAVMLADADTTVVITEQRPFSGLAASQADVVPTVLLLEDAGDPESQEHRLDGAHPTPSAPSSLAYVIHTSGSTGRPKGVMIENRSLLRFAREVGERLELGPQDRFLQFASLGFDVVVEELFPIWLAGGAVAISVHHVASGQIELTDLIERDRLTVIELPTAFWHEWTRELDRSGRTLPPCLRTVIIGGDRVLSDRLAMWRRHDVTLMHVYGLTETTVSSTFFRLDPAAPGHDSINLPIGTALPSTDLRVLDGQLAPVPPGGTGELYIGGISLARGYHGQPATTAERFVADPHPDRPGRRLYRTGDLVRRRADGNLEFVSRVDAQVKIRGFRVEPAEIEAALGQHPLVAECVVTAYEPAPGDRRLLAHVVSAPGANLGTADLRGFLSRDLPPHMVPSAFVQLEALPVGPNGKVARNLLPPPGEASVAGPGAGYVAPTTPQQQTLTELVAEVVGIPQVGVEDNFFEIGGDSILAIQVVARAQEAGLTLTPYDIFANPTIAALAELVATGAKADAEQGDVVGPITLSSMQRWFCTANIAEPHHWNRSVVLEVSEPTSQEMVHRAVEEVIGHHDGLRQRFLLASGRSRARIAPRGDQTPFEVHDLSTLNRAEQDQQILLTGERLQHGLDLAVGPLVRVALFRGGHEPDRLAVVAHRLVADPWSMQVVVQDLETAVVQLSAGEELRFLPKTTSWQSWCRRLTEYASSDELRSQQSFWSDLVAVPPAPLPCDGPEPQATLLGSDTHTVVTALDPTGLKTLVTTVAPQLDATVEEILLSAVAQALGEWSGVSRRLIAIERHDREALFDDVDLSRTVGWFSRIHPLVIGNATGGSLEQVLPGVRRSLRDVPAAGIGWSLLRQQPEPVPEPTIDLLFSCHRQGHWADRGLTLADTSIGDDLSPRSERMYAIEVEASVVPGGLELRWRHSVGRHRTRSVERVAERCLALVTELIERHTADGESTSAFPLARVNPDQLTQLLDRLGDS